MSTNAYHKSIGYVHSCVTKEANIDSRSSTLNVKECGMSGKGSH